MTTETLPAKADIKNRADIERLVNAFYGRVREDATIGFIFNEVAQVNWETHLPKMYSFWERVLFGTGDFRGNPMVAHARLVPLTEMGLPQFKRWLELFHATIDDLFEGEQAGHLKRCAEDMANVIYSRINNVFDPRFDPANLTPEQRERYRNYREAQAEAQPAA